MYFIFYLLLVITTINISSSFIKSPFQNKQCRIDDNNNCSIFNKIRYYFKNLNNNKNNKEIRKPAILELPIELEEKWDEGEIPWDFVDNNITSIKKNQSLNDEHRIAFLFI